MCLVSYVPLKEGYVLSSNRDESPLRAIHNISTEKIGDRTIHYPSDMGGGSWIFHSDQNEVICLLNGAFEPHERRLPYRMSRGLVMKSFFEYPSAVDFFTNFSFHQIEPFTMVIVTDQEFFEFRWDGYKKHISTLDRSKVYVWSSCTLYSKAIIKEREQKFREELSKTKPVSSENIRLIHLLEEPNNLHNGFVMNRSNVVATISLTQIVNADNRLTMNHTNLEV